LLLARLKDSAIAEAMLSLEGSVWIDRFDVRSCELKILAASNHPLAPLYLLRSVCTRAHGQ